MPDCKASGKSGIGMKINANGGTNPYRNKETQSGTGTLRYRTDVMDAGIPMPLASALMPMPVYANLFRFVILTSN
jgi:hypothetical protein